MSRSKRDRSPESGDITVIQTTGDDDSYEYGGGVLYRKNDAEFWQFWDEPARKNYVIWTAKIERDVFKQYKRVPRHEIAVQLGVDLDTLRTMGRSRTASDRLELVRAIGELEGRSTICGRQEELTPWEMAQRWGETIGVDPTSVARIDDDDYLIIEYRGAFGCGQLDGPMLGCFKTFECCATAIADHSEEAGNASNVYSEIQSGEIEKVEWARAKWVGRQTFPLRGAFSHAIWRSKIRGYVRESRKETRKLKRGSKMGFRGNISRART